MRKNRMWGKVGRFLCFVGMAVSPACTMLPPPSTTPSYRMPLEAVRRPADVQARWGDYLIEAADSSGYTYTDQLLSVAVVPIKGFFSLLIENRSDHSVQLVWDEVAYVGPDGAASAVLSGDSRVIDIGSSRPPETIPAQAKASVVAIPRNNFIQTTRLTRDFVCTGERYESMEGREVRLITPFMVEGVVNEYTFVFRLNDVSPPPPPTPEQLRQWRYNPENYQSCS